MTFRKRSWIYLIFFSCCFSALFDSACAEPSFQASVDRKKIFLNQTCALKIEFEWPKKEARYTFAIPSPDLQKMKLLRQGEAQETRVKEGAEWTRKTFMLEFQPLETGTAAIEEFQVHYVDSLSQKQGQFLVPRSSIKILRPVNLKAFFETGGAVLFSALLAIFAFRIRSSGRKKIPQDSQPPSAFDKFQEIQKRMAPGIAGKALIYDLSKEFRNFLAQYYQLSHREATEDELIGEIQRKELPLDEKKLVTVLLSEIREAKFVPTNTAEQDFKRLIESILEFVGKRKIVMNS